MNWSKRIEYFIHFSLGDAPQEEVLVAEHEDDGDHRGGCGRHPLDHHHLGHQRVTPLLLLSV